MVSERQRATYAAAVTGTGESSQRSHPTTPTSIVHTPPIVQSHSPVHTFQENIPQRNGRTEDIENPLYFSSNESFNAILVSPPLTGSNNYGTWRIAMRVSLEVKNKWTVVEGSTAAPDRSHNRYAAWRRCNLMIFSWIYSVHPSIVQSIMYMDNAKDVWNDLKKRFAQQDPQRISSLQHEIYCLKQGSLSVSEYYTKCRALWEQMNELRPLPMCRCNPRCSCNLLEEIRTEREVDQIIKFLQGLNDEYNSLKTNVLVLDPLPDIHRIFVMAEKYER
ncbi:PREDICTED: uncharacterized protein LOC109183989 [Ipomoea nil]|uniref:uncharacterized protein LOC109183989 n=1 Tax=Ipomoea nil TaxID=35883 RepID=UPI000901540B|nr:PREDICTED: uncharacterized protein LOC109183989 [Ipomoea nil]